MYLKNLFYILRKNRFDGISNVNNIYLLDGFLVMYEMEKINNMQNMKEIKEKNIRCFVKKKTLSSWKSALNLAEKLSNKGIVMYDLKEDNAFIGNGNFKVCDVDFYKKSLINLLNVNYMLVNTIFIEFIERYLFFENYECRKDDYLIETKKIMLIVQLKTYF